MMDGGQANRRSQQEWALLLRQVQTRLERFAASQDPATILGTAALAEATALLDMVPEPAADVEVAHAVGWLHWYRYLVRDPGDDRQDLAAALRLLAAVYQAQPAAVPEQVREYFDANLLASSHDPEVMAGHALDLLEQTLRTGGRVELDRAIDLLRRALDSTPDGHPFRATILSNLGAALGIRFGRTGHQADLDEAIDADRDALAATPAEQSGRAAMLSNLGAALQERFARTGNQADLDEAISVARDAVAATPADHPDRARYLSNLGIALKGRFERANRQADLNEAIGVGRDAVAATQADHPDRAMCLSNLGVTLRARFERAGRQADLEEAINVGRAAVAATPADHPARVRRLSSLSHALDARFGRTGRQADLDEAIELLRQALDATPADHPDHAGLLSNVGNALQERFGCTGYETDLDEAIELLRRALKATPSDHPARAGLLSSLCNALRARFERVGRQADVDEAIGVGREAVAATPADYPDRSQKLSNLGVVLRVRFERAGHLADLDEAISLGREAVAGIPADHPDRAMMLSNLSVPLKARFERAGHLADLDEAISLGREAVAAIPADHPDRAMMLSNLGATLRARLERAGRQADADEAIELLRQALDATPADHPDRAGRLTNLSVALRARFEQAGRQADADEAISVGRDAVAATPAYHPYRAMMLSNLGAALRTRFERAGRQADLDEAISVGRDAVAATPAYHPYRAMMLSNLGAALRTRFERAGRQADLDEAIRVGQDAVAVEVAPPWVRAIAARGWGLAAALAGRWPEAVAGFEAAVGLLGRVTPRSLTRSDQENLLQELGGLASEAAACCVRAGLTDRAIELFEQGRGVLLGQALDTRTDLTALAEQHSDLASRFTALRDELDSAEPGSGVALPMETDEAAEDHRTKQRQEIERRREAADAFDRVIAEIQALPRFATFLRPLPVRDLATAAADGPVVVVNVCQLGSHALILTSSGVLEPVPLEDLTPNNVDNYVVEFVSAIDDISAPTAATSSAAQAERRLVAVLGWLWDAVASPVLDRLDLREPPQADESWPRLWWCVSGLLSFLPLHAAGHHDTRFALVPATVIDRAVSSYTPTIRTLLHARRVGPWNRSGVRATAEKRDRMLVVAMPHTPDAGDLPGAVDEAALLHDLLSGQLTILHGDLRPD